MRVAQELARSIDERGAAAVVAHEVMPLSGIIASAVYLTGAASDELALIAQAGAGTRAAWERLPVAGHRAARSDQPTRGTTVDVARFAAAGVETGALFATPLSHRGAQLGVLVVACEAASPPDRAALCTVADLAAAALATLRRLADSADEARRDALTGLPNKRAFRELLGSALHTDRPTDASVSLVLFDIDDFKRINDTQGHPAGDRVLRQVARVTLRALRSGEEAFRVGGEEFAIVVMEPIDVAVRVAERVRKALSESTRETLPTISAGVSVHSGGSGGADDLVAAADAALYEAKRRGKNRVVVSESRADGSQEPTAGRSRGELRSVALLELPDVARSWLNAQETRASDAALVACCRYVATVTGGAGVVASLIVGSRLVTEACWFDASLEGQARAVAPILTRVTAVPLPGAPRLLRTGVPGYAEADVRRLQELGAASALMLGIRAEGAALGAVEVYARRRDAFLADEIQLASLAVRQLSALVVQRRHADGLSRRYRASVISLSAAVSGSASPRAELDTVGRLCRSVADACGLDRGAAFACELGGLLVTAAGRERVRGEAFSAALRSTGREQREAAPSTTPDPLTVAAEIVDVLCSAGAAITSERLPCEAAIVATVIANRETLWEGGGSALAES